MGTRTGTFYKEAEDSEEVAALSDVFSDASGDLGSLDWVRYVGDTDFSIANLDHTEADVIVEEMGAFEEDVLCSSQHLMMQMHPFRNDCIGAPRLIIGCCVPAGIHIVWWLWLCVIRRNGKCSIAIMTKDELGDIYQVVDNALKMGHGGGINGLRKPQRLRKMRL